MEERIKRYLFPLSVPIVVLLIFYTLSYFTESSKTMFDTPIWFQIVIAILLYLGGIACCIRCGLLGWDKL